ncbi:MAG: DNA alkylation repair protein [Chitinophagales bacterium]|jgi:3-methyladenine DNA glycosylase AlkD|nr:DNA alkylation repair protein [Chitinophagales bacterium]
MLQDLIQDLYHHANPIAAKAMKQYMRNKFDFLGIQAPLRKVILQNWIKAHAFKPSENFIKDIHPLLYHRFREIQYLGLDLLIKHQKNLDETHIDWLLDLCVYADWWDINDMLQINVIGALALRNELVYTKVADLYAHPNLWLRRCSLIFQLKYKSLTDTSVLSQNILMLCGEKDFFIQKAIGWSLREYAKTNPDFVLAFLDMHQNILSNLAKREAKKHLKC